MEITLQTMSLTVLLVLLAIEVVTATEDSVQIKNGVTFKTTSSTLRWLRPPTPGFVPKDAVVGSVNYVPTSDNGNITDPSQLRQNKIYVCRAFVNGNGVPGAIFDQTDVCIVSIVSKIYEMKQYDVLVNMDEAARLRWMNWDRQVEVPMGAVTAGEYYIAHSPSPRLIVKSENLAIGMSYRIGKIDPEEGLFGRMSVVDEDKNVVSDVENGQVLVETEPTLYELTVKSLTTLRTKVLSQKVMRLGEVTLRNDDDRQMKAESVIVYSWAYESNWGHGKAMLKGMETRILFQNSSQVDTLEWGLTFKQARNSEQNVDIVLDAGTASHVTVDGTYQEVEVPYTGDLLSVFEDSQTMQRTINDIWRYTAITDIKVDYGPLYFIQNNSFVPTTTTTTTETPPPTTTVVAATTTTERPITEEPKAEEKVTVLPAKDDQSNDVLNNDNSDAMQLKNKADADKKNSACRIFSHHSVLIAMFATASFISGSVVNSIT